ncbi:acyl-CoA dehydrogenase [Virgisporangium ochraceum]|jgi:alkylation response protein AidB-like acyl-CoA dehydrogenase|uniref:Acyl-CoA dehydrogenase n=1 Tax=Virgisporangium ochraceum TaxID=65505 RepID=A0A8J4EJU0_9ACTN|nr:acyl-CoA dehydrogenase family protein [Virgisporangium ochraceum]GIJ74682.1 acyl-CoA dehydrogenase [Virgisporangium ochraceum]
MDFDLTPEQTLLRDSVAALGRRYGHEYFVAKAKAGEHSDELWAETGKHGYLGVNLPEEYGGGGGGITELAIVVEELAAAGCPLLLLVVSQAIAGTIIAKHGTTDQKERFLSGIADGTVKFCFAITEPDAGSNFHKLSTVATRDGDDYLITGRKVYISGVDECDHMLVVARLADSRDGKLKPALFLVPTDAAGLDRSKIEMEIVSPENQFQVFFDEVRVPASALVGGSADAGLPALFSGLNPERITVAAMGAGTARYALEKASKYVATRTVWGRPIGSHQGVAHQLAHAWAQVELAKLAIAKAASIYDAGRDLEAGVSANLAKYASSEASALAVDTAIQVHGGNGMTTEYGVATLLGGARAGRIAPVSREMILNFIAQHVLGQEKSY